jgi:hypothetical protein
MTIQTQYDHWHGDEEVSPYIFSKPVGTRLEWVAGD